MFQIIIFCETVFATQIRKDYINQTCALICPTEKAPERGILMWHDKSFDFMFAVWVNILNDTMTVLSVQLLAR